MFIRHLRSRRHASSEIDDAFCDLRDLILVRLEQRRKKVRSNVDDGLASLSCNSAGCSRDQLCHEARDRFVITSDLRKRLLDLLSIRVVEAAANEGGGS